MNLAKFQTKKAAEEGRFMQFHDPEDDSLIFDDAGAPMGLLLLGRDSEAFNKCVAKLNRARSENIRIKRGGKVEGMDPAFEKEANLDLIVACVNGGHAVINGTAVNLKDPSVAKLFLIDFPCFLEQADEYITDRANYLGN